MGMLRLVRAFTKREKVIKFDGCYHGHADGFLVQAGSGVATLGLPDSPGVPQGSTASTLVAEYNNLANVEQLLKEHEVAAVILEPVVGNSGFIAPSKEFLVVRANGPPSSQLSCGQELIITLSVVGDAGPARADDQVRCPPRVR